MSHCVVLFEICCVIISDVIISGQFIDNEEGMCVVCVLIVLQAKSISIATYRVATTINKALMFPKR